MRTKQLLLGALTALLFTITACQKEGSSLKTNASPTSEITITAQNAQSFTDQFEASNGTQVQVEFLQLAKASIQNESKQQVEGPLALLILKAPELKTSVIKLISGNLPSDTKISTLNIASREAVSEEKMGISISTFCGLYASGQVYDCISSQPGYPGVIIEFGCPIARELFEDCMGGNLAY